jgi:formylglycine-generating enzyme required for sulfatase activity
MGSMKDSTLRLPAIVSACIILLSGGCNSSRVTVPPGGQDCDANITDILHDVVERDTFKLESSITCRDCGCKTMGYVSISAGTFNMGSPSSEPCRSPPGGSIETLHQVTLTHDFEISDHEVTQEEFLNMMGYNPSYFSSCGKTCPVESITWSEATAYCTSLSSKEALKYCYSCTGIGTTVNCQEATQYRGSMIYNCPGFRLPTEAEWEYAYRAGTTTVYYNGSNDFSACFSCVMKDANADSIGWSCSNSSSKTHAVKQKSNNAWGLYDMAGNVWEWCNDWYQQDLGIASATDPSGPVSGNSRRLRGGSYYFNAPYLRAAMRYNDNPASSKSYVGFRCVRSLSQTK